jgi:hypothetical protein
MCSNWIIVAGGHFSTGGFDFCIFFAGFHKVDILCEFCASGNFLFRLNSQHKSDVTTCGTCVNKSETGQHSIEIFHPKNYH